MTANTDLADINEIMLGYYLAGRKWFDAAAKSQVDQKSKKIKDPEAIKAQSAKAEVMAKEVIKWAKANKYSGTVKKVWWTARPGSLGDAVKAEVDQRKNPTDILVQFTSGPANGFLGISAKSTKGSGDIGFKNPGIGTVEAALNIKLKDVVDKATNQLIAKFKLPTGTSERKAAIRANEKILSAAQIAGSGALAAIRDAMFIKLKKLSQKELQKYILTYWMDADSNLYPPYIKATGMGSKAPYTAKIDDPLKNDKLKAITSGQISLEKIGNESIGVSANNKKILKMRAKFESEKLASSVKFSGDPW